MFKRVFQRHRYNTAENRRQVGRFLIIGSCGAATDFSCYLLLTSRLGVLVHVAKAMSYVSGVTVGFFGNKYWTFGSTRRSLAEPAAYLALYSTTLLVNVAVNAAVLFVSGASFKILAFVVSAGTTMVLNFLGLRLVTFRVGIHQRQAAVPTRSSYVQEST